MSAPKFLDRGRHCKCPALFANHKKIQYAQMLTFYNNMTKLTNSLNNNLITLLAERRLDLHKYIFHCFCGV